MGAPVDALLEVCVALLTPLPDTEREEREGSNSARRCSAHHRLQAKARSLMTVNRETAPSGHMNPNQAWVGIHVAGNLRWSDVGWGSQSPHCDWIGVHLGQHSISSLAKGLGGGKWTWTLDRV